MVKRTLWSLLVGAVAAVIPAAGVVRADSVPAPLRAATAPLRATEPGRLEEARPLIEVERRDERQDVPAPAFVAVVADEVAAPRASSIEIPRRSPDVAAISRRSLGRPRVRAPTQTT